MSDLQRVTIVSNFGDLILEVVGVYHPATSGNLIDEPPYDAEFDIDTIWLCPANIGDQTPPVDITKLVEGDEELKREIENDALANAHTPEDDAIEKAMSGRDGGEDGPW